MHSYCPSHLTLQYGFVTLPKLAPNGTLASNHDSHAIAVGDPFLPQLQGVRRPTPAPSANIDQWAAIGGLGVSFSVEIHNEP
ncbi:MAG TPA: hypothetical protein VFQ61_36680 [Polyangiaceae bacterium]|nr:hypothetical protein [Polyangiaceae bacterium]